MTVAELESRVTALEKTVTDLQAQLEKNRIAERIRLGLEQADRGEVVPMREAVENFRVKYNIPAQ